ncbi:MAG TPA: hypothetical protein VIU61_13615 [Kofleriaceae bacterium]
MFAWFRRRFGRSTAEPSPPAARGLERFDAGEPTLCDCACHGNPAIQHFAACCRPCDRCKRLFRAGFAKHRETCAG